MFWVIIEYYIFILFTFFQFWPVGALPGYLSVSYKSLCSHFQENFSILSQWSVTNRKLPTTQYFPASPCIY